MRSEKVEKEKKQSDNPEPWAVVSDSSQTDLWSLLSLAPKKRKKNGRAESRTLPIRQRHRSVAHH